MTKNEYLKTLQRNLKNVPSDEVFNIMGFYREYFEEAGVENEASVIEELGSPESLAIKAAANYVIQDIEEQDLKTADKKTFSRLWIIILAICGSPVWFPLAIAAAAVLFTLVLVVVILIIAFGIVCIACTLCGIISFLAGIIIIFTDAVTALMAMGVGLVCFGAGILFIMLTIQLFKGFKYILLFTAKKRINKNKQTQETR